MAGYSPRSLSEKLGLKDEHTGLIIHAPEHYKNLLEKLPSQVRIKEKITGQNDFIQFFTTSKEELEKEYTKLKEALVKTGMLWISWPKGKSKIQTDLNENIIRNIGLENGLVDVKVIAIDDDWSGLKFVYRVKDR
jgi:hypothetical protein